MWECTGGSAVVGDTSLAAAIREVKEETGLDVAPQNGRLVFTFQGEHEFADIWLFQQDFDIADVILQENETCDAKWATKAEIKELIADEQFIPTHYIDKLFAL